MKRAYGEKYAKPKGFISAFLHHPGATEFVQVGDGEGQGYFRILRELVTDERHVKNMIVSNASKFMAKRMRPNTLIANPTVAPTLATATTGGVLPAATYYVVYTWVGANGETLVSPEASITTTGAASTITATIPALPAGVACANVYISTTAGTETKQGSTTTTTYKQAAALVAGTAKPSVSTCVTDWGAGISYLEVGTGVGSGTTQAPQAEQLGQLVLRVPLQRDAVTSWTCLDTSGNPTALDTNVVQYTTTFLNGEANGALVEMGLFGGDSTSALGTGQMFNYKVFPVINKDITMQLTIVWKITY